MDAQAHLYIYCTHSIEVFFCGSSFYSLHARIISTDISLANSLNPDQARHFVGPDLVPNCLTILCYYCSNFLEILILKKISTDDKIS